MFTVNALHILQEMMEVATNQDPHVGVKTRFIIGLLKLLKAGSEKVLVFSQNLDPLLLLERMLNKEFGWVQDREFLQLDGKVPMNERQSIIQRYNDPKGRVRVLLASTKACGEGITLTGASRVIFMDVLWNPAVIRQAIHRAFRIGQTKIVHVYRLISSGKSTQRKLSYCLTFPLYPDFPPLSISISTLTCFVALLYVDFFFHPPLLIIC
jgi:DNA repair and recombination RAD54-like protein